MEADSMMGAVVLHVPHSSTVVPEAVMSQFVVPNEVLKSELVRMTDHQTFELFGGTDHPGPVVAAAVSRLVVDVERFPDDADEPMSARGMGAVYTRLSDVGALRRAVSIDERQQLLAQYYVPHHARFCSAVQMALGAHGCCLIIDAHSFPSRPLPYEFDQSMSRPDICIGTDPFHTPSDVCRTFVECFEKQGFDVEVDRPFLGAIVPAAFHMKDKRVMSVMVEVNRALYLEEMTGITSTGFNKVACRVQAALRMASEIVLRRLQVDEA
jgi:N-formylglutamate deformylase